MVSLGGKGGSSKAKNKAQQESKTRFPTSFFDDAYDYLGGPPDYNPNYVGMTDRDLETLENTLTKKELIERRMPTRARWESRTRS